MFMGFYTLKNAWSIKVIQLFIASYKIHRRLFVFCNVLHANDILKNCILYLFVAWLCEIYRDIIYQIKV